MTSPVRVRTRKRTAGSLVFRSEHRSQPRTGQEIKGECESRVEGACRRLGADSGRTVDLGDVAHVAKTFFSGRLRLEVVLNAVREVFRLGLKVRWIAGRIWLVQ